MEDFFAGAKQNGHDFAANAGVCNGDFFKLFRRIAAMEPGQGVGIEIYDYDQDEDEWPYAETCYIAAAATANEVARWFDKNSAPSAIDLPDLQKAAIKYLPYTPHAGLLYRCWWD